MKPNFAGPTQKLRSSALFQTLAIISIGGLLTYFGSSLAVDANSLAERIFGYGLLSLILAAIIYLCHKITLDWRLFITILLFTLGLSCANIILRIVENHRLDLESVALKPDLTASYTDDIKISDFLDALQGELVEDATIETTKLGHVEVNYEYINVKGHKRSGSFTINVVDQTAPRIYGNSSYTVHRGYEGNLTNLMLSGDDLDDHPKREISGTYDLNTAGNYNLEYNITDASGNRASQPFTLHVIEPPKPSANHPQPAPETKLPLADVIAAHKTAQTKIGIDVSAWQGKIDWTAVKAAGVEFAFIRLGYQVGYGSEYTLDRYFEANYTGATTAGLPVGVYFYSYADSVTEASAQANWLVDQLHGRELELGVAFDWEDWENFNQAGMSFRTLNQAANAYLDIVSAAGYQGSLYGSKNYMTRIWTPGRYPVWLAQYYDFVTYEGDYWVWQMSSSGQVPGINGNVDLDIMY